MFSSDFKTEESAPASSTASAPATSIVFTCAPRNVEAGVEWTWEACADEQGAARGVRLEVRDRRGNRVVGGYDATNASLDDSVRPIALSVIRGTGELLGTTTLNASAGVVDFTEAGLNMTVAEFVQIRATLVTSAGRTLIRNSGRFKILPRDQIDPVNGVTIITQPAEEVVSGLRWSRMPVIELRDPYGNLLNFGTQSRVVSTFSVETEGELLGRVTATGSRGRIAPRRGQFTIRALGQKTLTVQIPAREGTITRTFDPLTVVHGAAAKLLFHWTPGTPSAGSPFPTLPVIEVVDRYNNRVTTGEASESTITLKSIVRGVKLVGTGVSDSGVLTATTTAGVLDLQAAGFTDLAVDKAGRRRRLVASAVVARRTRKVASAVFNVTPGAASGVSSTLAAVPATGAKSDGVSRAAIILTLQDNYGNLLSGVDGSTITLQASDESVTIPAFTGVSDRFGRLITRITATEPGEKTISVASPSSLASTTPVTVTFVPGPVIAYDLTIEGVEDEGPFTGTALTSSTGELVRTFSTVAEPSKGTVTWTNENSGEFSYEPFVNAAGVDTFTYRVNDTRADSNVATVTVNITPVNDAPVANNGSLSVVAESTGSGTLTSNDPDGPSTTYTVVTEPTSGTVVIDNASTGAYTYTPNAQFEGSDSFTFKVSDGELESDPATISVTVTPSIPAAPSELAGEAPGPVSVDLTWTDNSWNEQDFVLERSTGEGSTDFASVATPAANATSHTDTGLSPGTTYNYRISARNAAGTSVASNVVTVATANTPGAPANIAANPGDQRAQLLWSPSAGPTPIQYKIQRALAEEGPFTTVATVNSSATSGSITYWNTGLTNETTYYYRVYGTNSYGDGPASAVVSVTPIGPPVLSYPESPYQITRTTEGEVLPLNEGGPIESCSISPDLPTGLELSSDCSITGTPPDYDLEKTYTVQASNAVGSDETTFQLQVNEFPPSVIYAASSYTLTRGLAIEAITPTTFEYVTTYGLKEGSPALPSGLSLDSATGIITGTVNEVVAPTAVTLTASNITGQTLDVELTFEVPNAAPTLDAIESLAVNEDFLPITVNLSGITTGSQYEADTLVVTATSSDPNVVPHPTVTYTSPNATGTLSFVSIPDVFGEAVITVQVNDGMVSNNTVTQTFTITVNPVNDAPTLAAISDLTLSEDASTQTVGLSGIATGAANELDTLTITATSSDPSIIPNPTVDYTSANATGSLSFTPVADANGVVTITVTVDDGQLQNNTAVQTFSVTIEAVNDAPTLAAISDLTILEDAANQTVNLTGISTGAANESDTLTITATSSNPGLIPDPTITYTSPNATGTLSFAPLADQHGTATITVTVNDGQALNNTLTRTFTVTVTSVNDAPTLAALSPISIQENSPEQTVSLTGIGTGAANENDTLSITATSSNPSLIPNPSVSYTSADATGSLSFTPVENGYGSATVTVTVSDGQAENGTTTQTFTVTVIPVFLLSFSVQPVDTRASTAMPAVEVTIRHLNGALASNETSAITLAAGGANPNGGTLSGTTTVNAVGGVATFSDVSLDRIGSYALVASGPDETFTGATSDSFNVSGDRLIFAVQPTHTRAGATMASVSVRAADGGGNLDSSYSGTVTLSLSTNPGSATLAGTLSSSASGGEASFGDLSLDRVGTGYQLTASADDLTSGVSDGFNITASELRFITQPSASTKASTNMAANPVVRATDSFGTVDSTFSGEIALALGSNPKGATLSAASLSVAATSGSATFTEIQLNKLGAGYTLLASSDGLTTATSDAFNITGDRLFFVSQPSNTPVGITMGAVTVGIADSFGNIDTTASPSVSLAIDTNPSGGTLTGGGARTASSGQAIYTGLSINTVGDGYTFVATSSGLLSATSNAFNISSCSQTISAAGQTLANGSYSTICVTGSGGLTIPSSFTGSIDTLAINGSTASVTLNKNLTFTSVIVASGTLTAAGFDNLYSGTTWTSTPGAGNGKLIFSTGSLSVGAAGKINMDGKGYAGGISTKTQGGSVDGPGASSNLPNGGGGGSAVWAGSGSYGTTGSAGYRGSNASTPPSSTYGESDFTTALYLGSGGAFSQGTGSGAGGGAIGITANSVSIASGGQITARGGNGIFFNPGISGAGSGGTVVLNTTSWSNSGGLISVAGGVSNAGNGGYGRMHIPLDALLNGSSTLDLTGIQGFGLRLRSTDQISTMTLGANSAILFTADAGSSVGTVTINGSGAQLILNQKYTFGAVNLTSGTITSLEYDNLYSGSTWTNAPAPGNGQLIFNVTGALTVGSAGIIQMDYKGYFGGFSGKNQGGSPSGPGTNSSYANGGGGGGPNASPWWGGGGSYGSYGSQGQAITRASLYGADFADDLSDDSTVYLGSGGASSNYGGGYGGGGIKVSAGSISLASGAQIVTRGINSVFANPWASGGGSGGTIILAASGNFTNSGALISASGGVNYSTGGHGRVAIQYSTCTGPYCPDAGGALAASQYVPAFTQYATFCQASNELTMCYSDSPSSFPPTSLALLAPTTSPGSVRTPVIRVSGGRSAATGNAVRLFSDSACTNPVGSASMNSSGVADVPVSYLTNDGSYLFFANIVNGENEESACSTASVAYVLDTTDASTPVLAARTASPGLESRPTFSVSRQGGGSFAIDEVVTLHEGADCSGPAVSSWIGIGSLSSVVVARTQPMSEGSTNFRVKVQNGAGNSACSNAIAYVHDKTPPTWNSAPVIAAEDNPFNSLSAAPPVTFEQNASDGENGSGVARYEYAIGTGPRGSTQTSVVSWTTIGSSPLIRGSLSLVDGVRYYVSMRAVDAVGLTSPIRTTSWLVSTGGPAAVTLAAAYGSNGANWNDYVKNDGPDRVSGSDSACLGTEANWDDCVHGGEVRKVVLEGESSCDGIEARDELGAFDWTCRVQNGQAVVFSERLKRGKGLRDLVDLSVGDGAWIPNRVTITGGFAEPKYQSALEVWWSNPFAALPDNSTGTAVTNLTSSGTIYTLAASRLTSGYRIATPKVAVMMPAGVTLSWNGSAGVGTSCSYRGVFCLYSTSFAWVEGAMDGGTAATKSQVGLDVRTAISFSQFPFIASTNHWNWGVEFRGYNAALNFGQVSVSGNTTAGLYMINNSRSLHFDSITANSNAGMGVDMSWPIASTFDSIVANGNSGSWAMRIRAEDSTFGSLSADSNSGHGINLATLRNVKIGSISTNDNLGTYGGIYVTGTTGRNIEVGSITTRRNKRGLWLNTTSNNGFKVTESIVAEDNTGVAIELDGVGVSVASIISRRNSSYGVSLRGITRGDFGQIVSTQNGASGVYVNSLKSVRFGPITASNNTGVSGHGMYLLNASAALRFEGLVEVNDNGGSGIENNNFCSQCFFGEIQAQRNGGTGIALRLLDSTVEKMVATSNYRSGIWLSYPRNNSFGEIIANDNSGIGNGSYYGLVLYTHQGGTTEWGRNTFGPVTANRNGNGNVYFYTGTGINNGNVFTGKVQANGASGWGMAITGHEHRFGEVEASGNSSGGIQVSAASDLQFGRVVVNGNRSPAVAGNGGFVLYGTLSNIRLQSLVAANDSHVGLYQVQGTTTGLTISDYALIANNLHGVALDGSTGAVINNGVVVNNTNFGLRVQGTQNTFNGLVVANNGVNTTSSGLLVQSASNNTFHHVVATDNPGYGINVQSTGTNNAFTGVLMVGGNGNAAQCYSASATGGVVNTTCASSATDGTTTYTGHASNAVLRLDRSLASSFVGGIAAPGDAANPDDGVSGAGTGTTTFGSATNAFDFEHSLRTWGKVGSIDQPLGSAVRGNVSVGSVAKIWDWALGASDTVLRNKSGDGSAENAAFVPGQACPAAVAGTEWVETRPYTYSTSMPAGLNGFASAGSSSACASGGTTCVQRFLKSATEIFGDEVGDDDGLCETDEACVYSPNFGAYQGHFASNDHEPLKHASHQCVWSAEGGLVTGVEMYGYTLNGRQPSGNGPVWTSQPTLAAVTSTSSSSSPTISYTANADAGAVGVARYEYAVGTGREGSLVTSVRDWTTTPSTSFQASGLSGLVAGQSYTVAIRAIDNDGRVSSVQYVTWTYVAAPVLSFAGASGTLGRAGALMLVEPTTYLANGGAVSCGIKAGTVALPSGLAVDPVSCAIRGIPSSAASGTYTLVASNSAGSSADATISLTILGSVDLVDDDSSSGGFGGGTHASTEYVSGALKIGAGGAFSLQSLSSSWTPKWSTLTGYWKLDGSGNVTESASVAAAVGVGGTATNGGSGMYYADGRIDQALFFDGSNDVVTIGTGANYNEQNNKLTVSGWVLQTSNSGIQTVASKYGAANASTSGLGWIVRLSNGTINFFTNSGTYSALTSQSSIPQNAWTHILAVYDGSSRSIYINGQLDSTDLYSGNLINTSGVPVRIGAAGPGERFRGFLDEVAIWNDALTAEDAAAIYAAQSTQAAHRGTFLSRVFDLGNSGSWEGLSWRTSLPFGKGLPGGGASSSESSADYPEIVGSTESTSDNDLLTGLVGSWNMNESFADQAIIAGALRGLADHSGNGLHAVATGIGLGVPGIVGGAMELNGVNRYAQVARDLIMENASAISASIWIHPTKMSDLDPIMGRWYESGNNRIWRVKFSDADGNIQFDTTPSGQFVAGNTAITTDAPVKLNRWSHVAVVSDGATNKIYVNGVEKASQSLANSGLKTNLNRPLDIGYGYFGGGHRYYRGLMDEAAFWTRALTPTEVQQLYLRGASRAFFQVRACTDSTCSGNSGWKGPDGTSNTYFSELQNNWQLNNLGSPIGMFRSGPADLLFNASGVFGALSSRFLQYRAVLETDSPTLADGPAISKVTMIPEGGNRAPAMSVISDVAIQQDSSFGPLAFTLEDPDTSLDSTDVRVESLNESVIESSSLSLGGSGSSRTISGSAVYGATGVAMIRVRVGDGLTAVERHFNVTVMGSDEYTCYNAAQNGDPGQPYWDSGVSSCYCGEANYSWDSASSSCQYSESGGGGYGGCMDSTACNYDPSATEDNGSCDYSCGGGGGCTYEYNGTCYASWEEQDCASSGGTWNGASCDYGGGTCSGYEDNGNCYDSYDHYICQSGGGSWDGSSCDYGGGGAYDDSSCQSANGSDYYWNGNNSSCEYCDSSTGYSWDSSTYSCNYSGGGGDCGDGDGDGYDDCSGNYVGTSDCGDGDGDGYDDCSGNSVP